MTTESNTHYITASRLGTRVRFANQLFQLIMCFGYAARFPGKYRVIFGEWQYLKYFPNLEPYFHGDLKAIPFQTMRHPYEYYVHFPYCDFDVDFIGYFQSHRYFESLDEKFIWYLLEPESSIQERVHRFDDVFTKYTTVGIHVRRGDYLTIPEMALPMSYYLQAMNMFESQFPRDKLCFLITSDDPTWCRQNFKPHNANIMIASDSNEIEDLFLLSKCHHLILSKSSFSWWAAFLNQNPDKTVVCATPWFQKRKAAWTVDIPMPTWIQLHVECT